jgi:hypothetical protein
VQLPGVNAAQNERIVGELMDWSILYKEAIKRVSADEHVQWSALWDTFVGSLSIEEQNQQAVNELFKFSVQSSERLTEWLWSYKDQFIYFDIPSLLVELAKDLRENHRGTQVGSLCNKYINASGNRYDECFDVWDFDDNNFTTYPARLTKGLHFLIQAISELKKKLQEGLGGGASPS